MDRLPRSPRVLRYGRPPPGGRPRRSARWGCAALKIPPGLSRYEIDARLDLSSKTVKAIERIRFTNGTTNPVTELVFHVYPRFRMEDKDRAIISKTLEILRLSPDEALDTTVRRLGRLFRPDRGPAGEVRVRPQERHDHDRAACPTVGARRNH